MHVKVEKLSKYFGGKPVVNNLSFEARPGCVFGILGPKGAGKTTAIRMLINVIKPDRGNIFYDDQIINAKIRNSIGYMSEERGLYQKYTLNKTLVYYARLKSLSRKKAHVEAVRLMDRFSVIEYMDTPIENLSPLIQHQVQIMLTIIHNPDFLLIDEPFKDLEPNNQKLIRKLIKRFKEDGKTVILGTDKLAEAESLCDEVILIDRGKAVLQDNLAKIKEKFKENLIYVEAPDDLSSLQDIYGVKRLVKNQQTARLFVDNKVPTHKILDIIIRSVHVTHLEVHRPNLNDIFMEVLYGGKKEKR